MLRETPKNALRVAFFDAIWPDATFIYLYRGVRETLYGVMEAWHSGNFRTYSRLPAWRGAPWSLLLVPGWQRLNGLRIPQVAAHQWAITTETLLNDLEQLDPARVVVADYRSFLSSPQSEIERLAEAVGLSWDRQLGKTFRSPRRPFPNRRRKSGGGSSPSYRLSGRSLNVRIVGEKFVKQRRASVEDKIPVRA